MHHVRNKVQKISKKPEDVLSPFILNKYSKLEYWKYPNSTYLKMAATNKRGVFSLEKVLERQSDNHWSKIPEVFRYVNTFINFK